MSDREEKSMDVFTSNWSWGDLWRTLLDFTAKGGVLQPQDDMPPPALTIEELPSEVLEDELPYDWLVRRCEEEGIDFADKRQHVRPKGSRGTAKGTRQIWNITALCWHQMAAFITSVNTALGIPAHGGVLGEKSSNGRPTVVLLHPILAYLYTSHKANSFSIGIEVAARAAGIDGDGRTFWRRKSEKAGGKTYDDLGVEVSDKMVVACRLLGEYYIREVARQGKIFEAEQRMREPEKFWKKVKGIVAQMFHRNSHKSRVSDPGSRIALMVVLWLAEKFGHDFGVPVVGSGKATPNAWGAETDPPEPYNWQVKGHD